MTRILLMSADFFICVNQFDLRCVSALDEIICVLNYSNIRILDFSRIMRECVSNISKS